MSKSRYMLNGAFIGACLGGLFAFCLILVDASRVSDVFAEGVEYMRFLQWAGTIGTFIGICGGFAYWQVNE